MTTNQERKVYKVSDESIKKVEAYLVERVRETQTYRISETVQEIAEGAKVALATAHKALKQLDAQKTIQIIQPSSRRYNTEYLYKGDITVFDDEQKELSQIERLQLLVEKLMEENKELKGQVNVLKNRILNQ